jgi:prepilin-type N-terminal cleavage/methylation domain-containing protein
MGSISVGRRTKRRARHDSNDSGLGRVEGDVSSNRPEVRRDRGFSIVEVMMTITLVSIAVIPLMDATLTSIRASSVARESAEVETVLSNAADRVNRAPTLCDYKIYVEAAALSKGWPADRATATYQYYVPGASALASDPGTWAAGACPGNARTPRLIQLVTISVTSASGDVTRTVKVVKSDV